MAHQKLLSLLQEYQISYTLHEHEPIFTCQDGEHLKELISGLHNKNLFLRDSMGTFYLISVLDSKRVDLKALALQLVCKRFSFAKAEDLFSYLQVLPGSVTPLALMFNTSRGIHYYIDEDLLKSSWVNFHPLCNDMTITLETEDFAKFLNLLGHFINGIKIPEK